jgi:TolB-like protein
VVLPFTNLSGDPSQDYFADGITENLTTDLSRIRNSFVIARNTAFTFKGKNIPAQEISKELGVRYVLEGSVQRDQNRVRVNAQLIDGKTGAHLWADRFEESITDLFKLQDEIVARLANSLGYELARAEAQRSVHSTDPDAIDLMMRGWAVLWQPMTKESTALARDYFERAIRIDPQNAEAMVGFAYARMRASVYGWSTTADYAAQWDLLTKATAINPSYTEDWPAMEQGKASPGVTRALNDLYANVLSFPAGDRRETTLLAEILHQLDRITQARRDRLAMSSGIVPEVVWLGLFGGAIVVIGFTFFFGTENLRAQSAMTGALSILIFSGLLIIIAIDYPLAGTVKVYPDALARVMEDFGHAPAQ